ncbi:uncharacterized protein [Antedon mediterranea]|uniref:uncharacterized protein n=1 Tax=Antedon mediterranea TaxID=105859 RepID=UPI003AF76D7E
MTGVVILLLVMSFCLTTKARTPGLKSELFRIRTMSGEATYSIKLYRIRCAHACLRIGFEKCSHIRIGGKIVCQTTQDIESDDVSEPTRDYEISIQDGMFSKMSLDVNYEQATKECQRLKGSLASYEQLVTAIVKYGENATSCDNCWLISGEVTFSNDENMCVLEEPATRCNIYPDRSAVFPCFYCYFYSNLPPEVKDYHSDWKILNLRYDVANGYIYTDAENRCQSEFGGHLALPMEVYNATLTGFKQCRRAWFTKGMFGNCCFFHTGPCWENILVGTRFRISEHHAGETKISAFCSLLDVDADQYPFTVYRIVAIRGLIASSLTTFTEADDKCAEIGGRLATSSELVEANNAGYHTDISRVGLRMEKWQIVDISLLR